MPAETGAAIRETLLKASTLLYLFRALADCVAPEQKRMIELPIIRLANDVTGTDGGFVVLASEGKPLAAMARERDFPDLATIVERARSSGITYRDEVTAAPLTVRGQVEGVIGLMGRDCSEMLGAIVTLASSALESAREYETLRVENTILRSQTPTADPGIIGASPGIVNLKALIERVAPREASVLILGESGTGKELIARAIHARSPRAGGPFIAINCAALTETLLESELFGYERGAFTGALAQKKGKLEMAEGGTVFLDEIGELAVALQAKILRVLQERTFERVGGTHTLKLDIRLIAATNRDLGAEAKSGSFRLDLYHRLSVVPLRAPALRDRPEDIPVLARHFLTLAALRCGRRVSGISPEAERCLLRYNWPGNVRELQNAIEHAAILGSSDRLLPEDLPDTILEAAEPTDLDSTYHASLGEARRETVIRAWK
ncbi:MAG TPA: sigma 54-interacting transcriptional regulator, partial [Bryobacteraceae bacterium]|nr:sigma 54-interacting transcriptional regulator [Bryobacteraceae bacterium]